MMKDKFLVTDLVPPGCIETLENMGYEVDHFEDISNAHLAEIIHDYTGIVVRTSLLMNREMIDRAGRLKYILRPGSGLDNINVPYAGQKGILIFNSPEANSDAVAEHTIALILGLFNFIPRSFEQIRQGQWIRKPNTGVLLKGKTVGIIGYGHTGSALARKLQGFEVNILVYDKYKSGFGSPGITESTIDELTGAADVVSFHIPLTEETRHMINDNLISRFRKPVYLINTSRGKIADLEAITHGLISGKISGAALDVLENENFESYTTKEKARLKKMYSAGNVIITPHIAGWTRESRENIFYKVLEKFKIYCDTKKNGDGSNSATADY